MTGIPLLATRIAAGCVLALALTGAGAAETPQQHVHRMGHGVMPFDLAKTTHVFMMSESGGTEQVVVKDPRDAHQIALVRAHLEHEAERFQRGDFSDPASLHGADMPGLRELAAGAANLTIVYAPLPDGGQITFEARDGDLRLITAVHRWFGAQLSEHGADATTR